MKIFCRTNLQEPLIELQEPEPEANAATTNNLLAIIQDLKKKVWALKEDKEDINSNAKGLSCFKKKSWQHYWTHGANKTHCSKNYAAKIVDHKPEAMLKNRMGGLAYSHKGDSMKKLLESW